MMLLTAMKVLLPVVAPLAQESRFFMPIEIARAYERGTRSYDGNPGPNYWQNTIDYKIDVTITPEDKVISGNIEAVYHNESPDEINRLIVRLYADAFKKGNSRMSVVDQRDLHDGVVVEDVMINGKAVSSRTRKTNMTISLTEPIKPGGEVTLECNWKQKIPQFTRYLRQGTYDSTSYFLAYWYPQIAVYDDLFGWDNLDFTFLSEFYNNLANFDVTINAPKEYMVWATGTLQNAKEILSSAINKMYRKANTSGEIVSIITGEDIEDGFGLKSGKWHYIASGVTDFAIALSDRHSWDAVVEEIDGRQVLISSVFPTDPKRDFSDHAAMQQKAMQSLSTNMPGIPYPYEAFTTFINGRGGGMEFPMMANNGGPGKGVTVHEMFHTYFPMYVRTNERRWSWMDEGWADFNTSIVINHDFDGNYAVSDIFASSNPGGSGIMGSVKDLPLISSTEFLTDVNYGYASYPLPAMVYAILYQELGDDLFLKCYREYIRRWAQKSPSPYDFFYTFEDVSGQDLGWLWKPWFFEFGYSDVAIKSFENGHLEITRLGNKPVPLIAEIFYKNNANTNITETASIWKDGKKEHRINVPDAANVERISVNVTVADINLLDNIYPSIQSMYEQAQVSEAIHGKYRHGKYGFIFNLVMEDDILYLKTNWGVTRILYPKDDLNFESLDRSIKLGFSLSDSGEVEGLEIDMFGSSSKARKL